MKLFTLLLFCCGFGSAVSGQQMKAERETEFAPQHKKIRIFKDSTSNARLALFRVHLVVNTDGTPISYHPYDPWGSKKAINTILNAIKVYRTGSDSDLCMKNPREAVRVFEAFRNSGYQTVPAGFTLYWQSVLVANTAGKPCVFGPGDYEGYFGSMAALTNHVRGNKGECNCKDQVDPLTVAGFTLPMGKKDPLYDLGANTGDLVFAYNPKNGKSICAVVNDKGPPGNLGEATVHMNMVLKGVTQLPRNITQCDHLTLEGIKVAVIPKSAGYALERPYTMDNIKTRLTAWLSEHGFKSIEDFTKFLDQQI